MKRLFLILLVLMLFAPGVRAESPAVTAAAFDDGAAYVSPLDRYGRAGSAFAVVSASSIDPERQDISGLQPAGYRSGFHRCHLIGAQLAAGTACVENLFTGTQYLNLSLMLPIENRVKAYVLATGEHVLYRVTPVYQGTELLPRSVEITAYSLESDGLRFSVSCPNIQPGGEIDYVVSEPDYVLNLKSHRFHYPWCRGAQDIAPKNRQDYDGDREDLIRDGFRPCDICKP